MKDKVVFYENEMGAAAIHAHPRTCLGCMTHSKDVLISVMTDGNPSKHVDIYLTQEQASNLQVELNRVLMENKGKVDG